MENALISVIVPVYNTADYLHRSIESILNQTHRKLEIILVNDGSTDTSRQICDEFAKNDNRVIVIHQENAGVSAARNSGLDAAIGDWIGFVDSDDWIEPDMYEKLLQATVETGKYIAVCGFCKRHLDGQTENCTLEELSLDISKSEALEHIISGRYYEGFMVNKIFHRRLFENHTRFDTTLHFCEDLVLTLQLLLKTSGVACVPGCLYHYCIRENSTINSFNEKRLTEITARKRVIELAEQVSFAKVQYVQSVIGILYSAGQHGRVEYFSMLRKEVKRYWCRYFFSSSISLKLKIRSLAIFLNPRIAYMIWSGAKRRLGLTWWRREIKR